MLIHTEIIQFMEKLHTDGYAVAIFSPVELQGASTDAAEDKMISAGWEVVEQNGGRIADVLYVDGVETLEKDL